MPSVRKAKSERDLNDGEALSDYLCRGDDDTFWKTWRKLQNKHCPPARIEGESGDANIVKVFTNHFSDIYASATMFRTPLKCLKCLCTQTKSSG